MPEDCRVDSRHIAWLLVLLACGPGSGAANPQLQPPAGAAAVSVPAQAPEAAHWRFSLVRGATAGCPGTLKVLKRECSSVQVIVENTSGADLECIASVTLDDGKDNATVVKRPGVVLQGRQRPVLNLILPATVSITAHDAQCKARPPLPPLVGTRECMPHLVSGGNLAEYYPPASRRLGEEGPVMVQFTLDRAEGNPVNVEVVGSSLFEHLDQAAVKFVQASVFQAPCPGTTYRIPVNFSLTR
jgi:TonB family protein